MKLPTVVRSNPRGVTEPVTPLGVYGTGDVRYLVLLVAVGVLFLWEISTGQGVPIARDIELYFVPWRHLVWESLHVGRLPLWSPYMGLGVPTLADFQSAVFYPPTWLYGALPFMMAFNSLLVLHLVLGGVFTFLFCREVRFSPPAAWVAAVSFMLGGYLVSLTNLVNALQAAVWAPALAFALVRHMRCWRPRSWLLLLGVCVMGFLAGEPETFLLGASTALLYALVRAVGRPTRRQDLRRLGVTMATVAPAAVGLSMVQVLPTLRLLRNSGRGGGLAFSQFMRYSLDPVRLVHLIVPNDFHDPVYTFGYKLQLSGRDPWLFSVYLGGVTLALACFALSDVRRRREVTLWTVLATAGLVLALGRSTPVLPWIYRHVPGLSSFRFPEKMFLLTGLAVPMLAAHGFDVLRRGDSGRTVTKVALLVLLGLFLVVCLLWGGAPAEVFHFLQQHRPLAPALAHFPYAYARLGRDLFRAGILLSLAALTLLLRDQGRVDRRVFVLLVPLLVTVDLWTAHRHLTPLAEPSFYRRKAEISRELPMDDLRTEYRYQATWFDSEAGSYYSFPNLSRMSEQWLWRQVMAPNLGALAHVHALDASNAMDPALRLDMEGMFRSFPRSYSLRLLRLSSVKAIYDPEQIASPLLTERRHLPSLFGYLYTVRDPVPRAHLARGSFEKDSLAALNAVLDERFDPNTQAVLLGGEARWESEAGDPVRSRRSSVGRSGRPSATPPAAARRSPVAGLGTARIQGDDGSVVRIRVHADTASYLVLHDLFYPDWHAYVDGDERPIYRADYFFRAVPVRPGDREVVFRYRSRPLLIGAIISGATLLLVAAGALFFVLRDTGPGEEETVSSTPCT